MNNKLKPIDSSNIPTTTTVNQTGKTNVHVDHAENITQNITLLPVFNRTAPGMTRTNPQAVSTEFYHLFVMGGEKFEQDHFLVPADRAISDYWTADDLRTKYGALDSESVEELKTFPALIMQESEGYYAKAGDEQQAYLGIVEDIRVQDNGIKIRWRMVWAFPMQAVCNIGFELGMKDMTKAISELNRTHWAIKHINLLEELKDAGLTLWGM